jgi:hypothetical protein
LKDGRPYTYGGAVAATHNDHVHWAYDQGGWLKPGMTPVMNATGRPEPVLSPTQWDDLLASRSDSGGRPIRIENLNVDATSRFRDLSALSHADRISFARDVKREIQAFEGGRT